jgi:hypothetical protein
MQRTEKKRGEWTSTEKCGIALKFIEKHTKKNLVKNKTNGKVLKIAPEH